MSRQLSSITDIAAQVLDIRRYRVLAVSASVTVTGFFSNDFGEQLGGAFSFVVDSTTPQNLFNAGVASAGIGTEDASRIVGAWCNFSADYRLQFTGDATLFSDFTTNPTRYPQLPAAQMVALGRVNQF